MIRKPDHRRLLLALIGVLIVMIGLVAFSEPLYRRFCAATGYGGTTQRVDKAPPNDAKNPSKTRVVRVFFDANVDSSLPWDFAPEVREVQVKTGETVTVNYKATNRGKTTLTGTATYNVQPDKAGPYFDKIQCFCFTKQTLKPGETDEMPVQFYVDPALYDDPNNNDVTNITLSYTFFLAKTGKL